MKKFILGFISGILLFAVLLAGYVFYKSSKTKPAKVQVRNCNFEIVDLQEYKGEYYPGLNYIIYEGVIKNNSQNREYLEGMIAKVYNENGVLISDGFKNMKDWIESGKALPFKVETQVDTKHNTVMRKYFNKEEDVQPDVYPWFASCK